MDVLWEHPQIVKQPATVNKNTILFLKKQIIKIIIMIKFTIPYRCKCPK